EPGADRGDLPAEARSAGALGCAHLRRRCRSTFVIGAAEPSARGCFPVACRLLLAPEICLGTRGSQGVSFSVYSQSAFLVFFCDRFTGDGGEPAHAVLGMDLRRPSL